MEISDAISPRSIHNGSCYVNATSVPPQVSNMNAIVCSKVQATCKVARLAVAQQQPPAQDGALVLQEGSDHPTKSRVVVDAFLARKLREHQKQGVQFLYNVRNPPRSCMCHNRCGVCT